VILRLWQIGNYPALFIISESVQTRPLCTFYETYSAIHDVQFDLASTWQRFLISTLPQSTTTQATKQHFEFEHRKRFVTRSAAQAKVGKTSKRPRQEGHSRRAREAAQRGPAKPGCRAVGRVGGGAELPMASRAGGYRSPY
jgi:hypothetical protein